MGKPGRNDPCPCGSGKKFKKCCGKDNVIAFDSSLYRNEIDRLYEDLIDFTFAESEEDLLEIVKHYTTQYFPTDDEHEMNIYSELVTSWGILTAKVKDDQTLFDVFFEKVKNTIKYPAVRSTFEKWATAPAGAFEVFPMDDYAELRDITTDERFKVPLIDEQEYERGNLAVGTLIPLTDMHDFFVSMIQLPAEYGKAVSDLIDEKLREGVTMRKIFPQFLADLLKLVREPSFTMDQFDWDHRDHEMVAHLFKEHATEKGYEEKFIGMTIQYWNDYCRINYPIVRKHAAHAAALDYFSQMQFLPVTNVTQAQLAKEYGTSAGTISNNAAKLAADLEFIMDMHEPDESSPSFNMEKEMRDLTRMIEGQEFESEDEMNAFLEGIINLDDVSPSEDPSDMAQDLLFEAREASGAGREKLVQDALNTHPLSPDAYLLLAEDEHNMKKRLKLLKKAVDVGAKDLGKAFFKENEGHFWGLIETRPYMRARAIYAMALEDLGYFEDALTEYMDLLDLNPNDNQGIRYLLLTLFIELLDFEAATALIDEYDEPTATFNFSRALIHFNENGITKDGLKLLKEANDSNPYVIDYLTLRKRLPNEIPDYVGFGDETEAIAYVQANEHLWDNAEEFLKMV